MPQFKTLVLKARSQLRVLCAHFNMDFLRLIMTLCGFRYNGFWGGRVASKEEGGSTRPGRKSEDSPEGSYYTWYHPMAELWYKEKITDKSPEWKKEAARRQMTTGRSTQPEQPQDS
jgi:hypothetical protein